jgi:YfiH family protein
LADQGIVIRNGLLGAIPHGFCGRIDHEGLPDPGLILANARLVVAKQVHSARAVAVSAPFKAGEVPEADALVTATPGLVLGIVTADCVPVLLADPEARVLGAAHAGWRGAFGGVIEACVDAMAELGADRACTRAVIGPSIAAASYEVDEAFKTRFIADDSGNAAFFTPGRVGHAQFDLPGYVRQRLLGVGIAEVADLALDTYADAGRFHSFRRATHRGEPTYGRQYSLIGL